LGGLWHGASWSFLVWGALHGLFLIAHHAWSAIPLAGRLGQLAGMAGILYRAVAIAVTFHLVCLAWCFFRLTDFHSSLSCVAKWWPAEVALFAGGSADLTVWSLLGIYGAVAALAKSPFVAALPKSATDSPIRHGFAWGGACALLLLAMVLSPGGQAPAFIYFQF
jgi:alginate O-acetyltransferase complex protein AlgI